MKNVVNHALTFLEKKENYLPDLIMIFQPTTPYRSTKLISESIKIFQNQNITSLITVSKTKFHPSITFELKNKLLSPVEKKFQNYTNRQNRIAYYQPTGALYAFLAKNICKIRFHLWS